MDVFIQAAGYIASPFSGYVYPKRNRACRGVS